MPKLSWNDYFMGIAIMVARRSTCLSPEKGAVITIEQTILSTGYNGAPRGIKDCKYEIGYCRKRKLGFESGQGHDKCIALHAEQNAIIQAARIGAKLMGSTIYCTYQPCNECAKAIINAGIKEVYYLNEYESDCIELFQMVGIKIKKLEMDGG